MKVGSTVRVVEDEYENMIGAIGVIEKFSADGTAAVVMFRIPVWCSVCNLEEVK